MMNDFEPEDFLRSFFSTAKSVLLSPKLFYENMKREGGLRNPFTFLLSCVLIHTLLIWMVFKNSSLVVVDIVSGIGMPFVTAGILFYIVTKLFKVPGTYEMAFRVCAYATAIALFSWIPVLLISLSLQLYLVYLIAVGLSSVFSFKLSRALLAVVITVFIYAVAFTAIGHIIGSPWPKAGP